MDDIAMPFSDPNPLLNPAAVASHEARAAGFLETIRQEQARLQATRLRPSQERLDRPVVPMTLDPEALKRSQAAVRRLRRML
jgi:hypothetical protein